MSSLLLKSNFHTDLVDDKEGQLGAVYDLRYDPKNGNVELVNQGAGLLGNPGVILFQNGDWTPEGLKIIPVDIIRNNYKNQIQNDVRSAHTSIGGNAANNILPSWAQASQQAGSPLPLAPATGNLFNLSISELEKNFKFGSVDENLKKTDLQYPKDALYNKTQDHLQIGQYHYRPPKSDQLFSKNGTNKILTSGLQKTSALAEFLGVVKLPMPNNVTDSNNVSWGDDNMNNLSAAATADVVQNLDTYLGATAAGGLAGAILGGNAQQGAALGAQGALLYKLLGSAGSQSAQALLKTAGASKVLSMASFRYLQKVF